MNFIARASIRRNPSFYVGMFVTTVISSALVTLSGQGFVAALVAHHAPGQDMGNAISTLSTSGGISLFVAFAGLVSALGLNVALRRREYASLRLAGASAKQVRRLIMREAIWLGLVGSVLGAACGAVLTSPALTLVNHIGLSPVPLVNPNNPIAFATAIGSVTGLSMCGALMSGRRASRIAPAEALRETVGQEMIMVPGRWITGTVFGLGGVAQLILAPFFPLVASLPLVICGALCLAVGVSLWAPVLLPAMARVVFAPVHVFTRRPASRIALSTITTERRRTAALAAPILAATTIVSMTFSTGNQANIASGMSPADVAMNNHIMVVVLAPAILYVLVSCVSAQVMTYSARKRALQSMRKVGIGRASLVGISVGESVLTAFLGIGSGLAITWISLFVFRISLDRQFGHATLVMPWTFLAVVCASSIVALVLSGAVAAHHYAGRELTAA